MDHHIQHTDEMTVASGLGSFASADLQAPMYNRGLEVGRRYRVNIDDCCVTGQLIGTFLRGGVDEEDLHGEAGKYYWYRLIFDFGWLTYSSFEYEPLEEEGS